ncbi:MAG: PLP-dependent aminotransferase family protein [Pseudomonadales bacterium]
MTLYRDVASQLQQQIDSGIYSCGEKLPGVRRLSVSMGVSVSTVVQAQRLLEDSGTLLAKPRSGYYVAQQAVPSAAPPQRSDSARAPLPVSTADLMFHLGQLSQQSEFVQMGFAIPHGDFLPLRALQRSLNKMVRHFDPALANYADPSGNPQLRAHISRRMWRSGADVPSDQILVTSGAQEALTLALKLTTAPGDIVAIESPTYYGVLQVIESLGLRAIEIATDPQRGISVAALEMALKKWPIKACVLIPNCHNPLGCTLDDEAKQQLVELAYRHDTYLIEDDIYGELQWSERRPLSLMSLDSRRERTLYYSSFSKTVSAGLRVGWLCLPVALQRSAERAKQVLNLSSNTLGQAALADYLATGGYDRHLRQVTSRYAEQVQRFTRAVLQYFPVDTRVTQPVGGYVLWVELAQQVDTLALSQRLFQFEITIAPGKLFSLSDHYNNCLRLNCAQPWSAKLEHSLALIGREIALLGEEIRDKQ